MATISAVIIDPEGTVRKADVENDLGAFQAVVGGYIEAVCGAVATIYINEEGRLQSLPFNPTATGFARSVLGLPVMLVGPALIVGPPDGHGNDQNVRPAVLDYFNLEN